MDAPSGCSTARTRSAVVHGRRIEDGNTWSWSQNENAATGIMLNQAQDPPGTPAQLLSLTAEEQARAAADPSTELSLVLGPLIPDPTRHRSLVVYNLLTSPKRDWRHDFVGSSIASME